MAVLDVESPGPDQQLWDHRVAQLPRWAGPPSGGRIVLVSPHPDDETLALGGTLHLLARQRVRIDLIEVTDGCASHPHLQGLGLRRRRERRTALRRLGIGSGTTVHELDLPDGQVAKNVGVLVDAITTVVPGAALVLAPDPYDGHPDHEATAEAARRAAAATATPVQHFPVWAWQGHDPMTSSLLDHAWVIPLPPAVLQRKRHALAAYRSQLTDELGPPIVPPHVVCRLTRPVEVVVDR